MFDKEESFETPKDTSSEVRVRAGACDYCGSRYRSVKEINGKYTCPTCDTVQESISK